MTNPGQSVSHGTPAHSLKAVSYEQDDGNITTIGHDAKVEEVYMRSLDPDTGEVQDGEMSLKRSDLDEKKMTIQEIGLCVQGTRMLTRVPMVPPYTPPTS